MRTQNLVSEMTLVCGHKVHAEVKHGKVKTWCDECDDDIHIENFGLFRAKCLECRYGAMEVTQAVIAKRAGYHANSKGHTVIVSSPVAGVTFPIEPATSML